MNIRRIILTCFVILLFLVSGNSLFAQSGGTCVGPDCVGNTCPVGGNCSIVPAGCTAPATPAITSIVEGDLDGGAIIQTRSIRINWSFSAAASAWGSGCSAPSNRFIITITGPPNSPIPVPIDELTPTTCGSNNCYTYVTGPVLTTNRTYGVTVSADNGYYNPCSAAVNVIKVGYPTGGITGGVSERDPGPPASCPVGAAPSSTVPVTITGGSSGYSYTCTGSGTLTCTITLNNTTADPTPNTTYTINLDSSSPLYGSLLCGPVGTSCAAASSCSVSLNLDANTNGGTTSTTQVFFVNYRAGLSYFKLQNSSYYGRGFLSSPFPAGIEAFDASDTPISDYFNRGSATNNAVGVVTSSGGAPTLGSALGVSPRGWTNSSYSLSSTAQASRFITYTTSRKSFTQVTTNSGTSHPTPTPPSISSSGSSLFISLADSLKSLFGKSSENSSTTIAQADLSTGGEVLATISSLPNNPIGMYYISGDLIIDNTEAAKLGETSKAMIVVSGKLHINANITSNAYLGFVANNIYIHENVSEVRALLSGNSISLVSDGGPATSATPLKIVGTLSSGAPGVDMTKRVRATPNKPSVYIVGPSAFIYQALLPWLSITRLDWRNIQ